MGPVTTTGDRLPISDRLRARLADPDSRIVVLTGAGISVAANLPTYRGEGGLYPTGTLIPMTASLARSREVHRLWNQIGHISDITSPAAGKDRIAPTRAHRALAAAEAAGRHLKVITQNIDGLHAAAGSTVVELHGNIGRATCLNPKCRITRPAPIGHRPDGPAEVARCTDHTDADGYTHTGCGARLRPDVVLFEELLDRGNIHAATTAAHNADVILAVGTSLQVYPAAGWVLAALGSGALGAWLELDPTAMLAEVDPADRAGFAQLEPVPGDCQETLPALLGLTGI